MHPLSHQEGLDTTQPQGAVLPRSPWSVWYTISPPPTSVLRSLPRGRGATLLPFPSQAIVLSTLEQSADLGLYESAVPTSHSVPGSFLSGPGLPSGLLLSGLPFSFNIRLKSWVHLGGSRIPSQLDTCWKARNLGAISAFDPKVSDSPPWDCRTCCMGLGCCQHMSLLGASQVGDGDQPALGFLALPHPA